MKKTGVSLIRDERLRQLTTLGRSIADDITNNDDHQLAFAASILVTPNPTHTPENDNPCPHGWDKNHWERMLNKSYKKRLIIAGALIAAEIDRINHL